jgi:calcineurin-like phosphoesterase family protein
MKNVFFSSDWHLNHVNIIKHSNRPFRNVDEMNRTIIANYNSRVGPNDELWFLGDFILGRDPVGQAREFLAQMRGTKHIILGNHDPRTKEFYMLFSSCTEYREIKIHGQRITLCHYAARVWNKSHHGSWMLYGHSHGSLPDDPHSRSFDVGVDCHRYLPVSFEEVGAIMAKKTFIPVDHHGEENDY